VASAALSEQRSTLLRVLDILSIPALAILSAFVLGAIIIWITSGSLPTVGSAYLGLLQGAFFKQRGFSETLVATTPYIFASLAVAVGFKAGLFNIGVEGQFTIGAVCAAWAGAFGLFMGLPAIIHLPLTLLVAALGGAFWAFIPAVLKAKTGAHEVINTIMMNYVAFRLVEFIVSGPLKDTNASAVQTPRISHEAELWGLWEIPERLKDPLNALGLALVMAFLGYILFRWLLGLPNFKQRFVGAGQRRLFSIGGGLVVGLLSFFIVPPLTRAWWPFQDQYDRLHVGLFLAIFAAGAVWWLLWRTTIGFEIRTVGANPTAAQYAGMNITRNIVLTMIISGALAGLAGACEVLGVSICRCLPLFFSSGYGFDSIAIALLAKTHPIGILPASFLFGALHNGADLMELRSGVSKHVISLLQALVLLFVAAPAIVRWMYRIRVERRLEEEAPLTRGWGG
jgi:ABC-type uncharacterized transport system permease subunit